MRIEITQKFKKQISKLNNNKLQLQLCEIIKQVEEAQNIAELKNLKKLKGFHHYYRIRLGNYRIGIKIENNACVFAAFNHRSDIYKYFP